MASSGNINRVIQLIIDVIDCKMLKGKYLVGMLSAHPMRLHKVCSLLEWCFIISIDTCWDWFQCTYVLITSQKNL